MSQTVSRIPAWEESIGAALGPRWRVLCVESTESTMDLARGLEVEPGAPAVVVAREQTRGRGRQGRSWITPAHGFLATCAFATREPLSRLAGFSLAVGVVAREELAARGADVRLKWPNDLLSSGYQKLGGVLVEIVSRGGTTVVLTGIGINLAGEPAEAASYSTLTGRTLAVPELAGSLMAALESGWGEFERAGFAAFREQWLRGACFLGMELMIDLGGALVEGVMEGVDESGHLLLRDRSGALRVIPAGHMVSHPGLTTR